MPLTPLAGSMNLDRGRAIICFLILAAWRFCFSLVNPLNLMSVLEGQIVKGDALAFE